MRTITLTILAMTFLGCSSEPRFKYNFETRPVTIITEPAGADVWQTMPFGQPGTRLGATPLEGVNALVVKDVSATNMPAAEAQEALHYLGNIRVEIRKEGFKPYVGFLAIKPGEKNEHRIALEPAAK